MSSDRVTLEVSERGDAQLGSRRVRRLRKEGPGARRPLREGARARDRGERAQPPYRTDRPSGLHAIVDVVIEGQTTPHHAVLKDFQRHPIRGTLTHVDFHEVRLDRPIQATVSLELVGESPGSKQGGSVQLVKPRAAGSRPPDRDPEHVELDISGLELGVTLRVEDLSPIEGVTFLDDPQLVLATCTVPRGLTELEEGAAEGEGEGEDAEAAEGGDAAEASDEGAAAAED
jgi:large subunit ribosomal protein L25